MVTEVGDKKERAMVQEVLKELMPDLLDEYFPQYMEKHRAELKRWFLNTEGFRSEEECKELKEACEKSEREKAEAEEEFQKQLKEAQERHEKELEEAKNRHAAELKEAQEKCVAEHDALERSESMLARTQNELSEAQAQATRKVEDAHKAQAQAEAVRKHYEANYSAAEAVVRVYEEIPEGVRQGLHSLLGDGREAVTLLVRLSQKDVLENLWEYAKLQIVHGGLEKDTADALGDLVACSLCLVNASHAVPLFAEQDIRLGERFQPNDMQKTPESRQQGTVRAVLLPGYQYLETGKLVKKSLVEVE